MPTEGFKGYWIETSLWRLQSRYLGKTHTTASKYSCIVSYHDPNYIPENIFIFTSVQLCLLPEIITSMKLPGLHCQLQVILGMPVKGSFCLNFFLRQASHAL